MSNNAYLINTPMRGSDLASLRGQWLIVAEAKCRIPLPWLCMFGEADLRPCTITFNQTRVVDGQRRTLLGKFPILNPCTSVQAAKGHLAKARYLFETWAGDAETGVRHWREAMDALDELPFEYLTIDPTEILLMDDLKAGAAALASAISSGEAAMEAKRKLADIEAGTSAERILGGIDAGFRASGAYLKCERSVEEVKAHLERLAKLDVCNLAKTESGYEVLPLDLNALNPPDAFWTDAELLSAGARHVTVTHGECVIKDGKKCYSTSLTNISNQRVRVRAFGGFGKVQDTYALANYTKEWFTAQNFAEWYGVAGDGWIRPGETVADNSNWGGSDDGFWAYWCETEDQKRFMALARNPLSPASSEANASVRWEPCLDAHQAAIAKNAEVCRQVARDQSKKDIDFDFNGVRWLDEFLETLHRRDPAGYGKKLIPAFASFLGECIVRNIGGQWAIRDGTVCIRFDENNAAFPFNKVGKHLANGREGGDSVLGFYEAIAALRKLPQAPSHPGDPVMEQAIVRLRNAYAARQKSLNDFTLASVRAPAPYWMQSSDQLVEVINQQARLLKEGTIVWAALVQANKLLFAPGDVDCPALLVYSRDAYFDSRPDELRAIGRRIFELKETTPTDPTERAIAAKVTDEMDRSMGWRLPDLLTDKEAFTAAFMVFRKHIPNGVLTAGRFPILIHPSTQAVMIVPFEFWPIELIVLWKEGRL